MFDILNAHQSHVYIIEYSASHTEVAYTATIHIKGGTLPHYITI